MHAINVPAPTDTSRTAPREATSRRALLTRSSRLVGGGALALALGGATVGRARAGSSTDEFLSDLSILQELLGLEHLESALYREALWRFSSDEEIGDRLLPTHPALAVIAAEEGRHVARLKRAIGDSGASPVAAARTYDFGFDGFGAFVRLAAKIEDAVVTALVGSVPALADPDSRAMVAGMLAAESRHAAHFAQQAGVSPFAEIEATPQSRAEALTFAAQFATS